MDAFYASVEIRDNPKLQGKPVIVGGSPYKRGVVCTCSYEARKYGIHSAMATQIAVKRCPNAIFIHPRFEAYHKASRQIRDIFYEYTNLVEPLSLDEAYLDVTTNHKNIKSATLLAKEILAKIKKKTQLPASAGVSYNKFLAKIASDYNKPNGFKVIIPEQASEFLENLDIKKFYGIGKKTVKIMHQYNIYKGKDLKKYSRVQLVSLFGKMGNFYYDIVRGIDLREVTNKRERKSYGKETTFEEDILSKDRIFTEIAKITSLIAEGMQKEGIKGRTITLKVKYYDFQQITRSISLENYTNSYQEMIDAIILLVKKTEIGRKKVRLVGVALSLIIEGKLQAIQLKLPFIY